METNCNRAKRFPTGVLPLLALACLAAVAGCAGGGGDAANDPGMLESSTQEADDLRQADDREQVEEEAGDEIREGRGGRGR